MAAPVQETISIGSKADTRGFKKAETAAAKLTKQVKSLAGALGLGLGTAAIIKFGKDSVKAFTDAEKSNAQLANAVQNLGFSFAQSNITNYLDKISASSGIAGEKLNEAFQSLLSASGSFLKSQELLNLALDVSAGSTVNLSTVSNDLAQAYVGNTRGLKKYDLGLTQSQLKVASFTQLQEKLNQQYSGANQAFLTTYAGKLQVLTEAAGNAQEIIGEGLVDALVLAGGKDADVQGVADAMQSLSVRTANTVRGMGVLVAKIDQLDKKATGGVLGSIISGGLNLGLTGLLNRLGEDSRPRPRANRRFMGGSQANLYSADAAAQKKFQQQQKKFRDESLLAEKKRAAELKKQNALKKAGTIFDLEQVGLIAALKGNLSEEERQRAKLQLALLTDNVSEAQRLTYEIAIAQGLGIKLANELSSLKPAANPFAAWKDFLDGIEKQIQKIASMGIGSTGGTGERVYPTTNALPILNMGGGSSPNNGGAINITVNNGGSVISQSDLNDSIVKALQDASLSGLDTSIARNLANFR
jgi:hypothetical protein